jgi:hypothetical protein
MDEANRERDALPFVGVHVENERLSFGEPGINLEAMCRLSTVVIKLTFRLVAHSEI